MTLTRREMLGSSAAALAGGAAILNGRSATAAAAASDQAQERATATIPAQTVNVNQPLPPGQPGKDYTPVITPNNSALPWRIVDGVKVYHLIAQPVFHEFTPGLKAHCWGYNGHVPGPTIEAVEGDRVRIYVTNKLPAPTSVHWHGIRLPNGMDGVSNVTQYPIKPGETFRYEFTLTQVGTFMYHSHDNTMIQEAMGLTGMFIIHPRKRWDGRPARQGDHPLPSPPDRDFAILLQEWKIAPGTSRPDPFEMTDFNLFTMNARCYPGTDPLAVRKGQRVRIRIGNLSAMDHHTIHLHGYDFMVTATGGGSIAPAAQHPSATVMVGVGQTRDLEFVANAPGDWVMHCHMTHHTMNQMGHGTPNMVGVNTKGLDPQIRKLLPGYMTMSPSEMADMHMPMPPNTIPMGGPGPLGPTMGGMFTVLKVRDNISDNALAKNTDPGWYEHPEGTQAKPATAEQLRRDGITL